MPQLPTPLRAAIGVIATVVEDRRSLPDRALELPVLAVSIALQMSLRAQQRYAAMTAKGDEFLAGLRGAPQEPPAWARFDEPPSPFADEQAAPSALLFRRTGNGSRDNIGPAEPGDDADVPATKTAAPKQGVPTKTVNTRRTGTLSAFDRAGDQHGTDGATDT